MFLGLGWSPDLDRVGFGLEENLIVEINEAIGKIGRNEVLALMLAFGQTQFLAGK